MLIIKDFYAGSIEEAATFRHVRRTHLDAVATQLRHPYIGAYAARLIKSFLLYLNAPCTPQVFIDSSTRLVAVSNKIAAYLFGGLVLPTTRAR